MSGAGAQRWGLRACDCLDLVSGLPSLDSASADVTICDPPYSARTHAMLGKERRNDGHASRGALTFPALSAAVVETVGIELARITRRWVLVFCDELAFLPWVSALTAGGAEYVRGGAWTKSDAAPQFTGDRPASAQELIVIAHGRRRRGDGAMRWNGGGRHALWRGPSQEHDVDREHPTQKPGWLMSALVSDFTEPGELILDPFAGSGSTGVAALRAGRRFLGYERSPEYAAVAERRLAATHEQGELALARMPRARQLRLAGGVS